MILTYNVRRGSLTVPDGDKGTIIGFGYSGADGVYKNNPLYSKVPDKGPIPAGYYDIGKPYDDPRKGPLVFPLTPDPSNEMYGRSGFLIHADNIIDPGHASEGCIILNHAVRETLAGFLTMSQCRLKVVPGF